MTDRAKEYLRGEARALICTQALAGISDPEAFMRKVRELMIAETSIPINRQIDEICEHLKGGAE